MASAERKEGSQDLSLDIPEVLLKEQIIVSTRGGRKLSIENQQEDGITTITILLLVQTVDSWSLSRCLIIDIGADGSQTYNIQTEAWKAVAWGYGVESDQYQYRSDEGGEASVVASSEIPLRGPLTEERLAVTELGKMGIPRALELPKTLNMKKTAEGILDFAERVLKNSDSLPKLAVPELVSVEIEKNAHA